MPYLTKKNQNSYFFLLMEFIPLLLHTIHSIKEHNLPPSPLHTFLMHCRGVFAYHKTMTMRMKRKTTLQYKYSKLL